MYAFAACGSPETNTADVTSSTVTTVTTETDTETSSAAASTIVETTAETASEQADTTVSEKSADLKIVPPDSDFWLEMFEIWCSDEVLENGKSIAYILGGSPAGSSKVFYVDVDGDGIKELCFIVDSFHGSGMYICDYIDNNWKIVGALPLGYYTYLQPNDDGTTSLFVVVATRYVERFICYTYNKGVEEEFELLDKDKLYEELYQIEGMNEQEEFFHASINDALKKYDDLTNLYDMPYVMTMLLYEVRPLTNESMRTENFKEEDIRRQLEEFTAEVAELFAE
ncbi:MAG: hypothetical protein K2H90_06720 [Oscillospiraceae bacterium]|nr:hypothetical protein [Oscillospiraceae bacterium]